MSLLKPGEPKTMVMAKTRLIMNMEIKYNLKKI